MARDEALMIRVGRQESPPTLRLYQWDPPTISLGYFQHFADYETLEPPAGALAVVRRLTGGGAILHDLEVTYSLALPVGHRLLMGGANELYARAHDAAIALLASVGIGADRGGETDDSGAAKGPFFCFARRHAFDVLIGNDKLVGSAQRRTKEAVLQHGSIILGNRFSQQSTARIALPTDNTIDAVRAGFPKRLAEQTGETFTPGEWTSAELAAAAELMEKYSGETWNRRA